MWNNGFQWVIKPTLETTDDTAAAATALFQHQTRTTRRTGTFLGNIGFSRGQVTSVVKCPSETSRSQVRILQKKWGPRSETSKYLPGSALACTRSLSRLRGRSFMTESYCLFNGLSINKHGWFSDQWTAQSGRRDEPKPEGAPPCGIWIYPAVWSRTVVDDSTAQRTFAIAASVSRSLNTKGVLQPRTRRVRIVCGCMKKVDSLNT